MWTFSTAPRKERLYRRRRVDHPPTGAGPRPSIRGFAATQGEGRGNAAQGAVDTLAAGFFNNPARSILISG